MRPRSSTLPTQQTEHSSSTACSPAPSQLSVNIGPYSSPGTPNKGSFRKRARTLPEDQKVRLPRVRTDISFSVHAFTFGLDVLVFSFLIFYMQHCQSLFNSLNRLRSVLEKLHPWSSILSQRLWPLSYPTFPLFILECVNSWYLYIVCISWFMRGSLKPIWHKSVIYWLVALQDEAYWERRRKNNEAAKRSRDSRRAKEDEIAIRAAFLEQENLRLRVELAALRQQTAKLRSVVQTTYTSVHQSWHKQIQRSEHAIWKWWDLT